MRGDGWLVLAFTRCNAPARADEWAAWYDAEHLPALLEAGGDVVTRFELVPKPVPGMPSIGFSHVAIHEFRGADAEARVARTLEREAALRRAGDSHPNHCLIDVHVLAAHGAAGAKSDPDAALEGHVMAYVMCNQSGREAEWDAWYDAIHLPDMMASQAFRAGSRWRRHDAGPYAARHLTLYDVAGHDLEEAVVCSAAVMPGIAAAGRKLDCHVGAMTVTLRACGRHGGAGLRRIV
ncbi:MAG: hypothetical protein R3E53_01145 [Myxococcota bacterium]